MSRVNWTQILIFGGVVLLAFVLGVGLLGAVVRPWGGCCGGGLFGGWGMMGGGMMWPGTWGRGMMGGGFGLLGWLGVIIAWLTRLGILALLVVGVLWLIRAVGQSGGATVATTPAAAPKAETGKTCPACGKPVQDDWQVCPYCGGALK